MIVDTDNSYPTRTGAEAAKITWGTVVESLRKIWLFTIVLTGHIELQVRYGKALRREYLDHVIVWSERRSGVLTSRWIRMLPSRAPPNRQSAAPHDHDLVLGQYSVQTSPATLRAGERRLTEIQHRLQSEGRL